MIKSELIKLNAVQNVVAVRGKQILPNAISLSAIDENRVGLFWYSPSTTEFKYSDIAKTHFRFEKFGKEFNPVGYWVRGAVIKAGRKCYLLVFKCDFEKGSILGPTLVTIYQLLKEHCSKNIAGIVCEEGFDLVSVKT